jgi:plastocyanin
MPSQFIPLTALCIAAALSVSACGSSAATSSHSASTRATTTASSAAAAGPAAKAARVQISNYAFHPGAITVAAGARVTFTNHDQTAHTATQSGGAFDTGTIAPGASKTVVLKRPGTYTYYCQFHAFMRATVVVK